MPNLSVEVPAMAKKLPAALKKNQFKKGGGRAGSKASKSKKGK